MPINVPILVSFVPFASSITTWQRMRYTTELFCLPEQVEVYLIVKFNIRNLMCGLVIIIVLAIIFIRGDQLEELASTMAKGAAIPLAIAIATQLGKYFAQSWGYHYAFKAVGESMKARSAIKLVFGTFFLNTIMPSLNLAGTTLIVDDARRRGIPPGKSTSAALLMQITIDGAFTTLMLVGFAILSTVLHLSPLWYIFGLIVICLVGGMITMMIVGYKNPSALIRILTPIARLVNLVLVKLKRQPLAPWVNKLVASFSEAAALIKNNPKPTLQAFGCSLIASCCELACFCLVGIAFGVTIPEALVCGYVTATLFAMVSITPQGVGFVEAFVTIAFTSFGVSAAAGVTIGVVYRGIVFWMPFLIGAILIQTTKTFKFQKSGSKNAKKDDTAPEELKQEDTSQESAQREAAKQENLKRESIKQEETTQA